MGLLFSSYSITSTSLVAAVDVDESDELLSSSITNIAVINEIARVTRMNTAATATTIPIVIIVILVLITTFLASNFTFPLFPFPEEIFLFELLLSLFCDALLVGLPVLFCLPPTLPPKFLLL